MEEIKYWEINGQAKNWQRISIFLMAKTTCESAIAININWLWAEGFLAPAITQVINWRSEGRLIAATLTRFNASHSELRLAYRHGSEKVEQHIPISWSGCPYGGQRPWLHCTGLGGQHRCGRRVIKLYGGISSRFACRHCLNLCYQSQLETPTGRRHLRAKRLHERIGGGWFLDDPPKPKGMHWKTYHRIFERMENAYNQAFLAAAYSAY